jgi:cysteine desulfurase
MIYLDYQATTPLAPEARAAMLPWLDRFGNPHSPHRPGREAAAGVAVATTQIEAALGVAGGQLVFTSGATEAANWALQGALMRRGRNRIVTLATEHACILDTADWLARHGAEVVVLPVSRSGLVDLEAAAEAIDDRTALVAAMLVNNEIGVIQPIEALAALAHAAGALFFCDAVQGFGRVALSADSCDLIAISAHKIHGPKGIGALWLRDGLDWPAFIHGGGQQHGLRSGTLSPMLCVGFGAAAAQAQKMMQNDICYINDLRGMFETVLEEWTINGDPVQRYPGNLNLRRDGVDAARLISEMRDVAFSAGSACASGSGRPSHVLRAIGLSDAQARGSIRLGFGRYTTQAEVAEAAALIDQAAARQLVWA